MYVSSNLSLVSWDKTRISLLRHKNFEAGLIVVALFYLEIGFNFQVSSNYYNDWGDLVDLWYLGMQVLSSLFAEVPWIAEFVMETGWPAHVITTLSKVR